MNYRKPLIRLLTFVGGLYFFLKFVLPERIGGTPSPEDSSQFVGGFEFGIYDSQITNGILVVSNMAFALGLVNLLTVHGTRFVFRRKGWGASVALLFGLASMVSVTCFDWWQSREISGQVQKVLTLKAFSDQIAADAAKGITRSSEGAQLLTPQERNKLLREATGAVLIKVANEVAEVSRQVSFGAGNQNQLSYERSSKEFAEANTDAQTALSALGTVELDLTQMEANKKLSQSLSALAVAYRGILTARYSQTVGKHLYDLLFDGLFISLGAAMFSLLGFYIAGAAYRAFRVRSTESFLMMLAAFLVMLGQIPFGEWLWPGLSDVRLWLLRIPSAGAARAIEIGAGVAGLIMAFRMWLSIESENFK